MTSSPPPGSADGAYKGFRDFAASRSDYDGMALVVWSILAKCRTNAPVRVLSCTNDGGVSPVGFVNVEILVNQTDAYGNAIPHGTIYSLPYLRVQGGANAVILDPAPNDIGMAAFCDRDISSVKASKDRANPGSGRMFDAADGVYLFGKLNGSPTQYVRFSAEGVEVVSPTKIVVRAPIFQVDAPEIRVNGQLTQTAGTAATGAVALQGPVTVTNDLTAQGTSVHTHTHRGVTPGGGSTGVPD